MRTFSDLEESLELIPLLTTVTGDTSNSGCCLDHPDGTETHMWLGWSNQSARQDL